MPENSETVYIKKSESETAAQDWCLLSEGTLITSAADFHPLCRNGEIRQREITTHECSVRRQRVAKHCRVSEERNEDSLNSNASGSSRQQSSDVHIGYRSLSILSGPDAMQRSENLPHHHCPLAKLIRTRSNHFFDTLEETSEMEFTAALIKIVGLISEACRNVEKLPAALITSGIVQAAAALALGIFKSPAGIFVGHGKAPFYMYYGILIAVIIFGFVEASVGFYVSGDRTPRRAIGMTVLWISILPIVLVAGLGGFAILK